MMTKKESELLIEEMHNVYANILASCHHPDFMTGYELRLKLKARYRHIRSTVHPDIRLSYNETFARVHELLKSGYGGIADGTK